MVLNKLLIVLLMIDLVLASDPYLIDDLAVVEPFSSTVIIAQCTSTSQSFVLVSQTQSYCITSIGIRDI